MRKHNGQHNHSPSYLRRYHTIGQRALIVGVCLVLGGLGIGLLTGGHSRAAAHAQTDKMFDDGLWRDVAENSITTKGERVIGPKVYRTVRLNMAALRQRLAKAPMEYSKEAQSNPLEMTLPMPDGKFSQFKIVESPMLAPDLAAQFPEIKTYSGHGIDDPTATMRFDLTLNGFHAFIISSEGTVQVAPYAQNDMDNYISYYLRDDPKEGAFACLVRDAGEKMLQRAPELSPQVVNGGTRHTYRLAVAATGEYTAQNGGTVAFALSTITTRVNAVNAIFNVEVAIQLMLVNNTSIIYTNAMTDPYTSGDLSCSNPDGTPQSCLLSENQSNLDTVIGSANYDIGQVFDVGGSGLASLGSVCNNNRKGKGTSGGNSVLLAAHEMGHQFGATHTFNDNTNGSCGSFLGANQRDPSSAYEPGSGSTIMSYDGSCATADLQPNRDSYFHIRSLEQMVAYTTGDGGGSGCDVESSTGNSGLVMTNYSPSITVPARTPFKLSIEAIDLSSNPATPTITWEEYDLGAASPPEGDNGDRPLFRSLIPVANGVRTFPAMQYVLNNDNIPPPTYNGGCVDTMGNPSTCLTGESRTTTTRNMTFMATARDGVNAIKSVPVQVNVVDSGAPFAITNLNTPNIKWAQGTRQEIIWNTANTASAPFNVANVKISISPNGGISYTEVLAESTPNDGNEIITVPEGILFDTNNARVKIESIIDGNFNSFFDVSNADITIKPIGVTNTNDSGDGSLRQAIIDANSDPGLTNIPFSIPGAGVQTINLQSELPVITKPVILDGWSQGGESYSGPPLIELNGANAAPNGTTPNGLTIFAGNSTVNGLAINRFSLSGIEIRINGGNLIEGCYIGTNAAGTAVAGNGASGVYINNTPNNRLGSPTTLGQFRRNIIAGNNVGISIVGSTAFGNSLYYNLIGTNADGAILGNTVDGIRITNAPNNIIGGTRSLSGGQIFVGTGNIISANGGDGVEITGASATGNTLQANLIGLKPDGATPLGNAVSGIHIEGAPNNIIGGTGAAAGNTISGNGNYGGIALLGSGSTGTTIQGNYLGINADGSAALANNSSDIYVESSTNLIGGTTAGARNVISGSGAGIYLFYSATGNIIQGNYIGTDATGTNALTLSGTGLVVRGANDTIIGGTTPAARNIISGNGAGITVDGGTTNLRIEGNYIGTNAAGTTAVGNRFGGVSIDGANNNTVGGTSTGAGNVISANGGGGGNGLTIRTSTGNKVQGNFIGTNAAGSAALGNASNGVVLLNSSNSLVGGASGGARNVISANGNNGVSISTSGGNVAPNNVVQGNYIGTDASGAVNLGNGNAGVEIAGVDNNTVGGTGAGEGNRIAFNGLVNSFFGDGVRVSGGTVDGVFHGTGNRIRGNNIFSNARLGIDLLGGTENNDVTANDSCDADTGSNNLQNFPVITSANNASGNTIINGTLNSTASTAFNIDFFSSQSCDASGNGEGQTYLGSATVSTDAGCNANINVTLPGNLPAGQIVTATATDPQGNTSEFSACLVAVAPPSVQFNAATYSAGEGTGAATITVTRTGNSSGAVAVDYAAANGTANGGAACANGIDYGTTSGTLNWADGDSASKTFTVAICDDSIFENDETVNLTLSNANGATLGAPATAVLTITNDDAAPPAPNAGAVIISEFRFRGPTPAAAPFNGASDEFVELYNTGNAPISVGDPASTGWALVAADGIARFIIPNGTSIPARGHFLAANNTAPGGYALSALAAADVNYTADIPDNAGLALFRSAAPANFALAERLDAVGTNAAGSSLYREGGGLAPIGGVDGQYSWARKLLTGVPQDTDDNANDFVLVATDGGNYGGVQAQLGAPGPENLASPIQRNAQIKASLIEPQQLSSAPPNRVRDTTPDGCGGANCALGTLDIRRRFKNNTGQAVTALRFRVVDVTTLNTPNPGGAQADLRLLNSGDLPLTTSLGNLTVRGTLVVTPPTQGLGGGLNSSVIINLPGSIAPGASVDVRFVLGVQTGGRFRFLINVEAATGNSGLLKSGAARTGPRP